jgi:Protein of unknown function (DUF2934)
MHNEFHAIQDLAYQLWEARGRPDGSSELDWLEAERQILAAPTVSQAVEIPGKTRPKRKASPMKSVSGNQSPI